MRFPIILLLLLIVFATCALADDLTFSQLYSQETKGNQNISADNTYFLVFIVSDESVKVNYPSAKSYILDNGECKFDGTYQVCLQSIRTSTDINEYNMTTQKYPIYATIQISKPAAQMTLTRTYESTSFLKGQSIQVQLEIQNQGSMQVSGATYTDAYPANVIASCSVPCFSDGHTITWQGNIAMGADFIVTYYIKGTNASQFTQTGTLQYGTGNVSVSDTLTVIDVIPQINMTISPAIYGNDVTIDIFISNPSTTYDISNMVYNLYMPGTPLRIKRMSGIYVNTDHYTSKIDLPKSTNTTIELSGLATEIGNFQISQEADYYLNDTLDHWSQNASLQVQADIPKVQILQPDLAMPGEPTILQVQMVNSNTLHTFTNVRLALESDLALTTKGTIVAKMVPYQLAYLNTSFVTPSDSNAHFINATLYFQTEYDQDLTSKDSLLLAPNTNINQPPSRPQPVPPEQPQEQQNSSQQPVQQNPSTQGNTSANPVSGQPEQPKVTTNQKINPITIAWILCISAAALIIIFIFVLSFASKEKRIEKALKELKEEQAQKNQNQNG